MDDTHGMIEYGLLSFDTVDFFLHYSLLRSIQLEGRQ